MSKDRLKMVLKRDEITDEEFANILLALEPWINPCSVCDVKNCSIEKELYEILDEQLKKFMRKNPIDGVMVVPTSCKYFTRKMRF